MPTCRLPPDRVPAGAKDWRTGCPARPSAVRAQSARRFSRRSCAVPALSARCLPAICLQPVRRFSRRSCAACPLFVAANLPRLRSLPVGFRSFLRRLSVCCRGFRSSPFFPQLPSVFAPPRFFVRCFRCLRRGHEKGDAAKSGIPVRAGPVSRVLFPGQCPGPCHLSGTAVTCRL